MLITLNTNIEIIIIIRLLLIFWLILLIELWKIKIEIIIYFLLQHSVEPISLKLK